MSEVLHRNERLHKDKRRMVEGIYQSKVNSLLSQIGAHQEKADLVAQDAPSSSPVAAEGKEGFSTYVENADFAR